MVLTKEQIEMLSPYEQHFTTAIRSRYARYPGQTGVHLIHKIYCEATGRVTQINSTCSSCVFRLLVDCGTLYFKDKEELEKMAEVKPKRTRKKS
jgi:hypothetical protein